MKIYPYFKWYPADAETDDGYSGMTNSQVGMFHRLLNRAWINSGIPADPEEIRKMLHVDPRSFRRDWEQVRHKFVTSPTDFSRLVNPRMEKDREEMIAKSISNQRMGNANAFKSRSEKNAIDPQHALARADYDCVSDSDSLKDSRSTTKPSSRESIAEPNGTNKELPYDPNRGWVWISREYPPHRINIYLDRGLWFGLADSEMEATIKRKLPEFKRSRQWVKDGGDGVPAFKRFIEEHIFDTVPGPEFSSNGGRLSITEQAILEAEKHGRKH